MKNNTNGEQDANTLSSSNCTEQTIHSRVRKYPFDVAEIWIDPEHVCDRFPTIAGISQTLSDVMVNGEKKRRQVNNLITYMDEYDGRSVACDSRNSENFQW